MRPIPKREASRSLPENVPIDTAVDMLMFLGDVAHLSRCVDIVSEKVSNILSRGEAKIHHIKYIDLAQNIDSLRSWANRIRDLTIDELESIEYGAIQFCNMRENLDDTLKHIETANTILDSGREDEEMNVRQSLLLGNELSRAGRVLGTFIGRLPITHRPQRLGLKQFLQEGRCQPTHPHHVLGLCQDSHAHG